jgi:hypothetical protein
MEEKQLEQLVSQIEIKRESEHILIKICEDNVTEDESREWLETVIGQEINSIEFGNIVSILKTAFNYGQQVASNLDKYVSDNNIYIDDLDRMVESHKDAILKENYVERT